LAHQLVKPSSSPFKITERYQITFANHRISIAILLSFVPLISNAQPQIDGKRLRDLSKDGGVLQLEAFEIAAGTSCQTRTRKVMSTRDGILVEINRPKQSCSFVTLTLDIQGSKYPAIAIAGFSRTGEGFTWGEGVASGDILFATPRDVPQSSLSKLAIDGFNSLDSRDLASSRSAVNAGNFVDGSGLEWMKCPLQANGTASCGQVERLTYFEAVEATAKLGEGWRLPEVKDFRSLAADLDQRLIARGAGNLRCGEYIFKEISAVLGIQGIMWSAKLYTASDDSAYRTKELMADAIAMEQVPNCRNYGGYYPMYGFNAELISKRYLTYAVKDPSQNMNATWERTARLVLTDRSQLVQQNEREREKEDDRKREDRARLFEMLRSGGGQPPASVGDIGGKQAIGSGMRTFVCEYKCTNAKLSGSDKTSLSIRVQASDKGAAEDETIRHGKATCYQQTQRVWDTGSQSCRPQ
jgi:hypothetical protein